VVATLFVTTTYRQAERDGSAVLSGVPCPLDKAYAKRILVTRGQALVAWADRVTFQAACTWIGRRGTPYVSRSNHAPARRNLRPHFRHGSTRPGSWMGMPPGSGSSPVRASCVCMWARPPCGGL